MKELPLDYSKEEYWFKNEYNNEEKKHTKVDVIFLNGTAVTSDVVKDGILQFCDGMKSFYIHGYSANACVFDDDTRMYIPYYRQVSLQNTSACKNAIEMVEFLNKTVVKTDLFAFIDYYFKNYNDGRPFILAGFSQGGSSVQLLLYTYFKEHRDYLSRMIAAYSIGCGVDKSLFDKYDYLKFAKGADDFGVMLSWNTEGPGEKGSNPLLPEIPSNSLIINPINWKTDETYASAKECKGSMVDGKIVTPGIYNLVIDHNRGSLICDNNKDYIGEGKIWGGKSLHLYEIRGAFLSIRENMHTRINAYFDSKNN